MNQLQIFILVLMVIFTILSFWTDLKNFWNTGNKFGEGFAGSIKEGMSVAPQPQIAGNLFFHCNDGRGGKCYDNATPGAAFKGSTLEEWKQYCSGWSKNGGVFNGGLGTCNTYKCDGGEKCYDNTNKRAASGFKGSSLTEWSKYCNSNLGLKFTGSRGSCDKYFHCNDGRGGQCYDTTMTSTTSGFKGSTFGDWKKYCSGWAKNKGVFNGGRGTCEKVRDASIPNSSICEAGCKPKCNPFIGCNSKQSCEAKYPAINVNWTGTETTSGYKSCNTGCNDEYKKSCNLDAYTPEALAMTAESPNNETPVVNNIAAPPAPEWHDAMLAKQFKLPNGHLVRPGEGVWVEVTRAHWVKAPVPSTN